MDKFTGNKEIKSIKEIRNKKKNKSLTLFLKISSFQILAMFRRGLFYSYLSIYLRFYLGLSVTQTTLMATLPMIFNSSFQMFVWGKVSDRYQLRKTLIIIGETIAGILTLIIWYLHYISNNKIVSGFIIIGGLAFIEIFWSMSNVGWTAMISDFYKEHERTSIQAKLTSLGGIGRIIGVLIGGILYNGAGNYFDGWGFYKGYLFFFASFVMIVSTIPIFFIPEGGIYKENDSNNPTNINKIKDANKKNKKKVKIKKDQYFEKKKLNSLNENNLSKNEEKISYNLFLLFLIALTFINFGRNSIAQIKTQYLFLKSGFNVSSITLSYIVNMQSLATILTGFLIGKASQKINDEILLLSGVLLTMLHLIGFAAALKLWQIYVFNFIAGIAEVIIISSSYTIVSILIPPIKRARLFAIYNATFFLSWGLAGTFFAGPAVDFLLKKGLTQNISYRFSFIIGFLITLIGLLIFILFIKKKKYHAIK